MAQIKIFGEDSDKAKPVPLRAGSWGKPKQCSGVLHQFGDQPAHEEPGVFGD